MKNKMTTKLRDLLGKPGVIVAPCAYDCVSLRIIEKMGFKVALHGGYNIGASLLGIPDIGLITMTESVGQARNMAYSTNIPLICDVDEGFGGINNVMRTTREVIRSGLAGMYIEDQVFPKRCPALGGNKVISLEDMIIKLKIASKVRSEEDPDFVIIARTHSSRTIGIEEAVRRGIKYAEVGADAIFVDLGYSEDVINELQIISKEISPSAHLIANMTETVGRPMLTNKELYDMGFKIVIYPVTLIITAAASLVKVLKELNDKGTTRELVNEMMPLAELGELLGIGEVRKFENEFQNE